MLSTEDKEEIKLFIKGHLDDIEEFLNEKLHELLENEGWKTYENQEILAIARETFFRGWKHGNIRRTIKKSHRA